MDEWMKQFRSPPRAYRSIPFWSWNDRLDPDELRRQIGEMKKAGLGGFFMHARGGLETDYLRDPWFDCIRVGLEEAKKQGLEAWVYDEEGWPSGFAGGLVTAGGEEYYARGIELHFAPWQQLRRGGNVLGVFAYKDHRRTIVPEQEMIPGETYDGYLMVKETACPYYIDVLNPKVVRTFLDSTHEAYARRFGSLAEAGLRGFFTDEPRLAQGPVPWSRLLPRAFRERFGYDLMRVLPALYLPCEGHEAVRYDFWSLVNEMFVNAYMKQIHEWCARHGCRLTGHMMMEESIYSQMTGTGGNMPFYAHMDMPGVDSLRRYVHDPRIPKQVGSVAEQLGRHDVISESFAMSGWDLNFEEMRWIAGWQFVNGVNRICPHLQAYSLRGMRKRDYPPSLFYQQSWWDEYSRFNDCLARLSMVVTEGEKRVDILMIHPMRSGWVSYDGQNNERIRKIDADFVRACTALSGLHMDYHFGDEGLMKQYASLDGSILRVGKGAYRAVVLPSLISIDPETLELLLSFAEAGGTIVGYGDFPPLCAGRPDKRLEQLRGVTRFAASEQELLRLLSPVLTAPISIAENGSQIHDIACCQRETAEGRILYLINLSRENTHHAEITLSGVRTVEELLLDTAEAKPVFVWYSGDSTIFRAAVLPMQSLVFRSRQGRSTFREPALPAVRLSAGQGLWTVESAQDNALTLDCCESRTDGGEWQPRTPVIGLMKQLLARRRDCEIELRFSFAMEMDPEEAGHVCLVLERPDQFRIRVNGTEVPGADEGYYKDISFRKIPIARALKRGRNEILLSTRFHQSPHVYETLFGDGVYETELNKLTYDMELESIYLIGRFGVFGTRPMERTERGGLWSGPDFVLKNLPETLESGDFTHQGFAFFAGVLSVSKILVVQKQDGVRVLLDLGHPRAPVVQLLVNGAEQKTFLWAPYVCDITDSVKNGGNKIELRLYASNRNLLGPHHNLQGELYGVAPQSFIGRYNWADRVSESEELVRSFTYRDFWTDDESFVTFGI